ncbi:unnamed protein product [Urochloa decumbens]|uniref:Uncharacterized protein n=1 Tax=Urochloa decumbens TaxID=240449 RepID=A0ABC9A117_9POAL
MASTLLRSSTLRRSAFRHVLSAAAADATSGAERLRAPLRRLLHSGCPRGQPPTAMDEKVFRIDQMQRQVQELNQLIDRDIAELLGQYKEYQAADHGYFERFLTMFGMPKSKFREDFIWYSQYSSLFVLSGTVGCLLADVEGLKN